MDYNYEIRKAIEFKNEIKKLCKKQNELIVCIEALEFYIDDHANNNIKLDNIFEKILQDKKNKLDKLQGRLYDNNR